MRGLCSSRKAARQGFCTGLVAVLGAYKRVRSERLLERLVDATRVSKKMKGQEQRDGMFGRVFGYIALLKAGRLDSHKVTAAGGGGGGATQRGVAPTALGVPPGQLTLGFSFDQGLGEL